VNGNHTPYEQREKRRPADGALGQGRVGQSEPGRFQVLSLLLFRMVYNRTVSVSSFGMTLYKHPDLFAAIVVYMHVVCTVHRLQVYRTITSCTHNHLMLSLK
jgi:hypothetical protein